MGFSSPPRTRVVLDPSRVLPFMALDKVIDLLVTSNPFSIALFFTVMPSTRKIKPGVGTTVYTFVCFLAELIVRMTGSGVCVAGIVDCISIFQVQQPETESWFVKVLPEPEQCLAGLAEREW